jgi:Domain of unknown function (DUF4129)
VNRALLALGLAVMGVCWVYPWSLLVAVWTATSELLSPLTMLTLVLLAAASTQVAMRSQHTRKRGQATVIALGLAASLVAVRIDHYPKGGAFDWLPKLAEALAGLLGHPTAPAIALFVALLLWRRGAQLASDTPTFLDVEAAFRWSIGALVCFALALALAIRPSQQPAIEARATPFVVESFFVALLTLALARLESLRTRTQALALNTQWLGVLIAVAGVLVLASLAVAQVLSFDLLLVATRPLFDLLGRVALILLYAIVIPLAYVIQLLVYWLMQLLGPDSNAQPPEPPRPSDLEGFLQRLFDQLLSPDVLAALKAIGAVVVLGVAVLLIARVVARWRPRQSEADATQEERESVYQAGTLWHALLAWLRNLRRRYAPPADRPSASASTSADRAASPSVSSVRELYRRLLALGASAGTTRPPASTPYEHEPALNKALHAADSIAELTDAYVQVRYAEVEPADAELRELRAALERIDANDAVRED